MNYDDPDANPDDFPMREPDEHDHRMEPILHDMTKLIAYEMRDRLGQTLSGVTIDISYRATEDADRHVRIIVNIDPEEFEQRYIQHVKQRLLEDANNIISGKDINLSDHNG